jgi:spermidine/putrescine-binding protein
VEYRQVIAKVTASTGFADANAAATSLVPAELRSDPTIYPDAAAMQRLTINRAIDRSPARALRACVSNRRRVSTRGLDLGCEPL